MNDDNINRAPTSGGAPRKRTVVVASAVGVAGLVAGGLAAGAISSASAESSTSGTARYGAPQGYGAGPGGQQGDPSKPMRSDEKLLTGSTRSKVIAAVKAKYSNATIQRAETDSDGVYEAHIVNGGTEMIVQVGKSFTITGTQSGHSRGGPGDHDGDHRPPAPPTGSSSSETSGYQSS